MKNTSLTILHFFKNYISTPITLKNLSNIQPETKKFKIFIWSCIYFFHCSTSSVQQWWKQKKKLYMSNIELRPIHKIFRITTSSIKYAKNTVTDIFKLHIYNVSPNKITLFLGTLAHCKTKARTHPTQEQEIRVKNILEVIAYLTIYCF